MKSLAVLIVLLLSLPGLVSAREDAGGEVDLGTGKLKQHWDKVTKSFVDGPSVQTKTPEVVEKKAKTNTAKALEERAQIAKKDTAKTMQALNEQAGGSAVGGIVPPPAEAPKVVQPLPVVSASMDMVFAMNRGLYAVEVEEVKGKAHDLILPKHIGQFSYNGFDGIVLKATVYKKRWWWWPKKILEVQEDFKKGTSWVWVFDYRGAWRTQDLSELPPRKS